MIQEELYRVLEEELRAGRPVAQARVIETHGSTPRKPGSAMLVKADGSLVGTIGGGCGEAGVIQKARLSLLDGRMREELADLTEEISTESEAVCGGTLRVFIQPWRPEPGQVALATRLHEAALATRSVLVHQVVKAEGAQGELGHWFLQDSTGPLLHPAEAPAFELPRPSPASRFGLAQAGPYQVYTEYWVPTPTLVIVGAGHIAEPLEAMGRIAGFRTVVIDDRRMFANRERFPGASEVVCGPILHTLQRMPLPPRTFMVLVTRGHTLDMDALRVVVERGVPLAYLGMIGSVRRVKAVFELLAREGIPRERLGHVRAPIGLDIGAETPAEIAICILAEMIAVLREAGDDTRAMSLIKGVHPSLRKPPG
ncbi:MAG: XdhC family protein [Candidatus Lambdaproteobacteria bacterium]|nr:XdhC family protein [Candidatus Lambdaproteobacteria bacterium]